MINIKALEKNIKDREKIIDKLMLDPIKNKKSIDNAKKYIKRTQKKINQKNVGNISPKVEQKVELKKIMIDTSERKAISIKIKTGVLNALKKEHPKYQTLINAILESYVLNKNS